MGQQVLSRPDAAQVADKLWQGRGRAHWPRKRCLSSEGCWPFMEQTCKQMTLYGRGIMSCQWCTPAKECPPVCTSLRLLWPCRTPRVSSTCTAKKRKLPKLMRSTAPFPVQLVTASPLGS